MSFKAPVEFYGELFNGDKVTPAIAKAANVAKTFGLALVKAKTPVDTGNLRDAWQAQLEGNGIRWQNNMPYAGFVELGTRKMSPRHMLTDSLVDISLVFEEQLSLEIGKALGAQVVQQMVSTPEQPSYSNQGTTRASGGLSNRKAFDPRAHLSKKHKAAIKSAKPLLRRGSLR